MIRERIWSTEGVPTHNQLELWQQVASEAFVNVAVSSRVTQGFPSRISSRSFGGVEVSRIVSQVQQVERRSEQVGSETGEKVFVNIPLTLGTRASQAGRTAALRPGDLTVVDSAAPFELAFERPLKQVSLAIPHELLSPWLTQSRDATAVRIDGSVGLGRLASQSMRTLATMKGPLDSRAASALGRQAAELLALALGSVVTPRARLTPELILEAARDEIRRSISDVSLTPALVADRVGVSVRYLHRLFSESNMSFGRSLLAERLRRCHEHLADPGCTDPIGDLAFASGFKDPAYFARAYRSAYGVTPTETRRRARAIV